MQKYVKGTAGKLDYRVIAESGNCVAAIKPIFETGKTPIGTGVAAGVRIRVCLNPDKADYTDLSATEIAKAFPNLPLHHLDATRGSLNLIKLAVITQPHKVIETLEMLSSDKTLIEALASKIEALLTPQAALPKAEVVDYIVRQWANQCQTASASIAKVDPKEVATSVEAELAKVLGSFNKPTNGTAA